MERERLINRRRQGDLGELSAMAWLAGKGAAPWMPVGHSPDVDLIAEVDGRLLRVQVKTATSRVATSEGEERWHVAVATSGGNQSWTGVVKRFDPDTVDFLFALVGDGRRWFIPAGAVEGQRSIVVGGPKYSQFEVERGEPIMHLVYGEQAVPSKINGRGSFGVGEPSGSVKAVATPEWVRIPPPPSNGSGALDEDARGSSSPTKFERTRISQRHQVTIPSVPFRAAGLEVGDHLRGRADGPGRIILERIERPWQELPALPVDTASTNGANGDAS